MAKTKTSFSKDNRPIKTRKGIGNELKRDVQEMIIQALNDVGGIEYLKTQAVKNPTAFMTLVGKVLPLQLTGKDGKDLEWKWVISDDRGIPETDTLS